MAVFTYYNYHQNPKGNNQVSYTHTPIFFCLLTKWMSDWMICIRTTNKPVNLGLSALCSSLGLMRTQKGCSCILISTSTLSSMTTTSGQFSLQRLLPMHTIKDILESTGSLFNWKNTFAVVAPLFTFPLVSCMPSGWRELTPKLFLTELSHRKSWTSVTSQKVKLEMHKIELFILVAFMLIDFEVVQALTMKLCFHQLVGYQLFHPCLNNTSADLNNVSIIIWLVTYKCTGWPS